MERSKAPGSAPAPREQQAASSQAASLADNSPRQLAQRRQLQSLFGAANPSGPVLQGAFIINGNPIADGALTTWIQTNVPRSKPAIAAVIRGWAQDVGYTTDHADIAAAYRAAELEAEGKIAAQNSTVAHQIAQQNPPNAVAWAALPIWAPWYFVGLEYQNNATNGWHANRHNWLPGGSTPDGEPSRYVEFRRPDAVGKKDVDKLERCVFDLETHRCYPNAHYDGGYVEIANVPGGVGQALYNKAVRANGMQERENAMTPLELANNPAGVVRIRWLLARLAAGD